MRITARSLLAVASLLIVPCLAHAQSLIPEIPGPEYGKLLATGGLSNIDGAGGGGLATWATITGYGTKDSFGADLHYSYVGTQRFDLQTGGVSVGLYDRVELSYAHQFFDTENAGALLGLGKGFTFEQDIIGVKVRLFGDAVYGQDSILPQVAVGLQYKSGDKTGLVKALGAKSGQGLDYYVAFTKIFLDQSLVVDATIRATRANEDGLLGFGGPLEGAYSAQFEGSVGYLVTRSIAVGGEYRTMPHNLGFTHESDWKDIFATYFVNKNASITLAYVDLGTIATFKNQRGVYVSAKLGF